ncbi:MAG: hypothetical protein ACP5IX_00410 [Patescibacteria group bacterium]
MHKIFNEVILKFCELFQFYPTLNLFFLEAQKKKLNNITIKPIMIKTEFPLSGNYILEGRIELQAPAIKAFYIKQCYEALVKAYYENKEAFEKECRNTIEEEAEKIRKKAIQRGLNVITLKIQEEEC